MSTTSTSTEFFNDAVGEIGNMMMGAGATNLAGLLGVPVSITTPQVDEGVPDDAYPEGRSVVVRVELTGAVSGHSVFLLPTEQTIEIVKLMTEGMDLPEEEILGEFGMSAIGEAMNQLIAGAARALGEIVGGLVDITPPFIEILEREDIDIGFDTTRTCTISFNVQIGANMTGRLSWLMDRELAAGLIQRVEAHMAGGSTPSPSEPVAASPPPPVAAAPAAAPPPVYAPASEPSYAAAAAPPPGYAAAPAPQVQPASFPELRAPVGPPASQADIAKLSDVTLNVTVELGRTTLKVKELLGLGPGSVVELDRIAGAPVDILVNGTLVARGDVVVVDDELGVRVSEVIDPSDRKAN